MKEIKGTKRRTSPSSTNSFLNCHCSCNGIFGRFFFFPFVFYFIIIVITLPTISSADIHSAARCSTSVRHFHILRLHFGNLQPGCYRRDKRRCSVQAARCQIFRSARFCGFPGSFGNMKKKKKHSAFIVLQKCINWLCKRLQACVITASAV